MIRVKLSIDGRVMPMPPNPAAVAGSGPAVGTPFTYIYGATSVKATIWRRLWHDANTLELICLTPENYEYCSYIRKELAA